MGDKAGHPIQCSLSSLSWKPLGGFEQESDMILLKESL